MGKKAAAKLRALAAIMEHWDVLEPSEQCDWGNTAYRLISDIAKDIEQAKQRSPELIKDKEVLVFQECVEIMHRLIQDIPPHTHDEPS